MLCVRVSVLKQGTNWCVAQLFVSSAKVFHNIQMKKKSPGVASAFILVTVSGEMAK